jgi:hypothetical protein
VVGKLRRELRTFNFRRTEENTHERRETGERRERPHQETTQEQQHWIGPGSIHKIEHKCTVDAVTKEKESAASSGYQRERKREKRNKKYKMPNELSCCSEGGLALHDYREGSTLSSS